ncbi:MAG: hypothetical protein K5905_30880 [Roseibium sp.]|uniref:hypothetical protein n=1 Tax=Roseibium sp. TaxID=1936156 RepID=UPI002633CE15|nr:hypothetical protein [Roseibium sp.]MCV0429863.1 hypothetical protein [Roseibium sp.]
MAEQITDKEAFLEKIAGRRHVNGGAWVIVSKDGKVEGVGPRGGSISGNLFWEGAYYCRTIVFDDEPMPENHQAVSLDGDTVTYTRDRGTGSSMTWTLE